MSETDAFDAIELNIQLTEEQRAAVMERLRKAGWINPDGTVSQHYWIKYCREEMAKAAERNT